ncbi:MAG: DsbA family protein [Patescibacteria group bacterium]
MRRVGKISWLIGGLAVVAIIALVIWQRANLPEYPDIDSPRPVLGNASAGIVIEEFSDFQCPACKSAGLASKEVVAAFGDQIAFYYKHFPLTTIHPYALRAAMASECANDQGKFWEYHDTLFANQPKFSQNELIGYAGDLELDVESFTACLKSRAKNDLVREDMKEGDRRNVRSTPSFFVNGEQVKDWIKLKDIIQAKLVGG